MVAKCVNVACDREFRELSKGRLFLLPPTEMPFLSWGRGNLSDYCFWLCPECDATYTVTRGEAGVVVSRRDPNPRGGAPATSRRGVGRVQIRLPSYTETA